MSSEFALIQRYFSDIRFANPQITLGVGDDAAALAVANDNELVFSIDTQNAGVHFPENAEPLRIAQRAFYCAISDLAAMGAEPLCFTLALTLPEADENWLQDFATGLKQAASKYQCSLVGGDTTKGPLSITLQVQGTVPKGQALTRQGAQTGDAILVTGYLGGAAAYIRLLEANSDSASSNQHATEIFQQDYYDPQPPVMLASSIRTIAHCAIDVSDGLLSDVQHLCDASQQSARLLVDKLPMRPELVTTFSQQATELALTGGDDYQLCFTAAQDDVHELGKMAEEMECPLTVIGEIIDTKDDKHHIHCLRTDGSTLDQSTLSQTGYSHF